MIHFNQIFHFICLIILISSIYILPIEWKDLINPDANHPASKFLKAVAKLKGNINLRIKVIEEEYVKNYIEMSTTPLVVPYCKSIQ